MQHLIIYDDSEYAVYRDRCVDISQWECNNHFGKFSDNYNNRCISRNKCYSKMDGYKWNM